MKRILTLFLLFFLVASRSWGEPLRLEDYGHKLPEHCIVEGSFAHGGLQPDYLISPEDPKLMRLYEQVDALRQVQTRTRVLPMARWELVASIRQLVKRTLIRGDYEDPVYRKLMRTFRNKNATEYTPIPLGLYAERSVGVCRENAMLFSRLLTRAGVENRFLYAKIGYPADQGLEPEDHGFVIFEHDNDIWAVDSYFSEFDRQKLRDLLHPSLLRSTERETPNQRLRRIPTTQIVQYLNYPIMTPIAASGAKQAARRPARPH